MFTDIAAMAMVSAINEMNLYEHGNKMFELSIANLSDEQKTIAREKRRLEQREDRKHRELCQAIRDSKPAANNGIGVAGLIFGSCLTASIINNDQS